jgi:hypothetical protein
MTTRIVTYAHRYKRPPRKKPKAAALAVPAIVKAPSKGERIRRREAADAAREVSPEEMEEEARVADLVARMMRPR